LLSVHCDDSHWVRRAEEILKQTGAEDIASAGESHGDFAVSDKPMMRGHSTISDVPATPVETVVVPVDPPVVVRGAGVGERVEQDAQAEGLRHI
jgi:hypothetical protein